MDTDTDKDLRLIEHHKQLELCTTRPAYRQGRKLTSVKVYTVNNESQHLYVYGVPSINLRTELKKMFDKYGKLVKIHVTKDVPTEQFTECYHVQFERIQSARIAKRFMDNKNFYGGVLHVCYAPEQEAPEETIAKLLQRKKDVLSRLPNKLQHQEDINKVELQQLDMTKLNRKRKHPALEITDERLKMLDTDVIWKNIPNELDPRIDNKQFKPSQSQPVKHYKAKINKQFYGPIDFIPNFQNNGNEDKNTNKMVNGHQSENNKLIPASVIKATPNIEKTKQIVFHKKKT